MGTKGCLVGLGAGIAMMVLLFIGSAGATASADGAAPNQMNVVELTYWRIAQIPIQTGKSTTKYPADQAYAVIVKYQKAYNAADKKTIKSCFMDANEGERMAQKSKGSFRMPTNCATIVMVEKDNKTATVILVNVPDPNKRAVSVVHTVVYYLKSTGTKFKIYKEDWSGPHSVRAECDYPLARIAPTDRRYCRIFNSKLSPGARKTAANILGMN
jgi:hypothetical protein